MKIFLSWSKDLSHEVAQYFSEWLPGVIQECSSPFISSDIDKGEPWFETITTSLGATDLGLVFITAENQDAVWLNFEAGAMLNKFGKSGVCPILVGLKKGDYDGPLKNLQLTELADEGDVKQLLGTINKKCANPLDQSILDKMLGVFWPDLRDSVSDLITEHAKTQTGHPVSTKRKMDDKVDELLSLMRGLAAKESAADLRLAESNAMLEELLSTRLYRPGKKGAQPNAIPLGNDARTDGAFDRIANRVEARKQRLDEFVAMHGSLEVILPDQTRATVQDISGIGRDMDLIVRSRDSEAIQRFPLSAVTVLPF